MPERWFVIAHEATNSGAPRVLLRVLQGVRAVRGQDWSCEILMRRGGVLLPEFAQLGPVHLLAHPWGEGRSAFAGMYRKFVDRPWRQPRRFARWMAGWQTDRFDFVYNNTATNGYLVPAARKLGCAILTHVHEQRHVMRHFNTPAALADTMMNTDHFVAVSPPVAEDLVECGAAADRITVVPNFLTALPPAPRPSDCAILRQRLGLPLDATIVTGCGHIHSIKGTDLFVELAALVAQRTQQSLCFPWLGGVTDARFARRVRRLVRQRNLEQFVRFVGPVSDSAEWFAASDFVAVTSRLESFPLVALEAASLGRPVIGFSGARGLACVLGDAPDLLAPGHDPLALAAILCELVENPVHAHNAGQRLRTRVGAEFLAGPHIESILSLVKNLQARRTKQA